MCDKEKEIRERKGTIQREEGLETNQPLLFD